MDTPGSVIDALGGTDKVAEALSQTPSTVSGWRKRGIPSAHWPALVSLAESTGCADVTLEALALRAARKPILDEARAE